MMSHQAAGFRRVMTVAVLLLVSPGARAADDPSLPESPLSETRLESAPAVPAAFGKDAPETMADLRNIEQHVVKLIPRLKECTVGLRVGRAQGSGVIISSDGFIATAAHVVGQPGRPVVVIMPDGTEYSAITLGRNQTLDAALIKLQSSRTDWPHAPFSREPSQLGDWCLAIGHPGGYQQDRGLVVRLGRVIIANKYFVQSDCELIGGDSGGPLFDMQGNVLAISSRIGEPTNYNFHVPASAYTGDWDRLVASEDFRSHSGAYLGVSGEAVTGGIKVTKVFENTPASDGGIQVDDVIVTFQKKPVATIEELVSRVGNEMPGRMVTLEVLRENKPQTIRLRLAMRWD
jgi:serine protease Do